eukprot:tig00000076_g2375.t1
MKGTKGDGSPVPSLLHHVKQADTKLAAHIFHKCAAYRTVWESYSWSGDGWFWLSVGPLLFGTMYFAGDSAADVVATVVLGFLLDALCILLIKLVFKRERPPHNRPDYPFFGPDKHSLPSGHTSRAFFIACWALHRVGWTMRSLVLLLWAFGIGASRLALGRHYPSDVFLGSVLGCLEFNFLRFAVLDRGFSMTTFISSLYQA